MQETKEMQVQTLGQKDLLEEGVAIHSSVLARRILCTEVPGELQSMGSQRVKQLKSLNMHMHDSYKEKVEMTL